MVCPGRSEGNPSPRERSARLAMPYIFFNTDALPSGTWEHTGLVSMFPSSRYEVEFLESDQSVKQLNKSANSITHALNTNCSMSYFPHLLAVMCSHDKIARPRAHNPILPQSSTERRRMDTDDCMTTAVEGMHIEDCVFFDHA